MMGVAERFNKAKKDDGSQYLAMGIAMGIALGLAIGAGIGVAIQNIAVGTSCGMALGLAIGVGIGSLMARKTKRASGKTRTHLPGPNS
jgi:F0F1-type ATP synthase assembly protein I